MGKVTRRERERQRHRREILAAAQDLFSRKGFDRTSMAEIADRAEFAVGTLYKLFEDKQALYRALILDTVREFEAALSAALNARGSEIEKLERYIETKADLFVRHIPTARLYFGQTAAAQCAPTVGLDRAARALYEKVLDRLESLFRAGIRRMLFVEVEPKMLALGLEGISNAFLPALVERPDDFSADEMAALTKKIFFGRVSLKAE
ncbi:MAG: hypothetical protein CHACPFDD_03114 [Phycisphaerae bacterium]|nr:hypothetical protein [Phycisphaerae bacterium]